MRKAFLIAIAACCIGTSKVYGQIGEPRNDLAIGFNAGYTLNQVMFNPTIQQKFKGAPTFGFTARYTCEKYFKSLCSIQLEVNYTNLGWEELIETSDDTYKRDINYIQIPLLARMGWGYEQKGCFVLRRGRSASRLLFRRQGAQRWAFQRLNPEPPSGTSKPTIRHAGKEQI